MKAAALQKALPVVVGIIADRTGVEVKTGAAACTDGNVVYLPPLPLNLEEEDFIRTIGYVYHECGHVEDTDFSIPFASPLQRSIANPLEDIRIERRRMARSPGAKRYLNRMVEILTQRGLEGKPESFGLIPADESVPVANVFQAFLLYKLRHDVLGQVAIKPLLETAEAAMERFPKGMRTRLEALMFEIEQCENTADVFALTDEIIRMIEEEEQREEQQNQSPDGESDDEGPSGSSSNSDDAPMNDGGQHGTGGDQVDDSRCDQGQDLSSGSHNHGGNDDSDDQEQEDQVGGSKGSGAGGSSILKELLSMQDKDVMETLDEMLQKSLDQVSRQAARSGQVIISANVHPMRLPNKQADTSRIKGSINAIRVKTLAWMSSVSECDTQLVHTGKQLDYSRLYQARFGGPMFARTEEGIDLNANVSILIDRSGSMDQRIQLAAEAALATLLAFDIQGISTQVATFPVAGIVNGYRDDDGVAVIKGWNESPRYLGGRIQSLSTDGSTPMAQAILWAACDLLKRDEESRHVLLVVTDGDPDDVEATSEVIELARASGVHVLGLGINSDTKPLFGTKCSAVISEIKELAGSMIKLVKHAMSN